MTNEAASQYPFALGARVIDVRMASEITGLAVQTLYNLRSAGGGPPSFTLRGRVRYYRSEVDAWIDAEARRHR